MLFLRVPILVLLLLVFLVVKPANALSPITENRAHVGQATLHYLAAGTQGKDLIVFLHGFPEYSGVWRRYLAEFGDDYLAIAPDMRGYGQSTIFPAVHDYTADRLVEDIVGLVKGLGYQQATIVGHDWGGSVGWLMAIHHPEMVRRLVVFNAPHPYVFNRLYTRPDSQQFHMFWHYRAFQANAISAADLRANHYALLKQFAFSQRPTSPDEMADFVKQWQRPGSIEAQVNYYKALNFQPIPDWLPGPILRLIESRFHVPVPVLMLWGEDDSALSLENLEGVEAFVPDLRIERFPKANHWSHHQLFPHAVPLIRAFL